MATGPKKSAPDAKLQALKHCGDMLVFIKSWGTAMSACAPTVLDEYLFGGFSHLNEYRQMLGVSWEVLEKHKNPHAEFKLVSG